MSLLHHPYILVLSTEMGGGDKTAQHKKTLFFLSSAEENKKVLAAMAEAISVLHSYCSQAGKDKITHKKTITTPDKQKPINFTSEDKPGTAPTTFLSLSGEAQDRPDFHHSSAPELAAATSPPGDLSGPAPPRLPCDRPRSTGAGGHILNTSAPHRSGVDVAAWPG